LVKFYHYHSFAILIFTSYNKHFKPLKRLKVLCYKKCLADRFQMKFREGKTKRKKPPHF